MVAVQAPEIFSDRFNKVMCGKYARKMRHHLQTSLASCLLVFACGFSFSSSELLIFYMIMHYNQILFLWEKKNFPQMSLNMHHMLI